MTCEAENKTLKNELAAVKKAYELLEREAKRLNNENEKLMLKLHDITVQQINEIRNAKL